jgi:putative nucleotidyltransferase with HDIG domain
MYDARAARCRRDRRRDTARPVAASGPGRLGRRDPADRFARVLRAGRRRARPVRHRATLRPAQRSDADRMDTPAGIEGRAAAPRSAVSVPASPAGAESFEAWVDRAMRRIAPISPWALQLLSMSPDAEGSDRVLRELVGSDPALLARVVGTANSRAFNPKGEAVTLVAHAIRRLGTREVWRLAAVLALGSSARIRPELRPAKRALWVHSFTVAHAARALAASASREGLDPDKVFVAALLHDIGLMVLLAIEPERCIAMLAQVSDPTVGFSPEVESRAGLPAHARVGAELCRRWSLPDDMVRLVGGHGLVHPLDHAPADRGHAAAIELGHQLALRIAEQPGLHRLRGRDDAPLLQTYLRLSDARVERVCRAVRDAGPKIAAIADSA